MFSLDEGRTVPALVYVTFSGTVQVALLFMLTHEEAHIWINELQVYYNLGLERGITLSSLVHCPGMVEEAADLLQKLGVDSTDMKQLQQVQARQNHILHH